MPLPVPAFSAPAEGFLSADESHCDPGATDRLGVRAFIKFVTEHQGGVEGRIMGPCNGKSGHASGRAWDWTIRVDITDERARADELIAWLLADDAEIFRRAGLSYIIWDRKIWSATNRQWQPYDGYDESGGCTRARCRDPHTSHVHFSFNAPGADGQTSLYTWLSGGGDVHPLPALSPYFAGTGGDYTPALATFAVAFMTAAWLAHVKPWKRW